MGQHFSNTAQICETDIIFKLHHGFFAPDKWQVNTVWRGHAHCTQTPVNRKESSPQLFVFVHRTVPFTKTVLPKIVCGISPIDAHRRGPSCRHQLGITVARYFIWMEQQAIYFACYMQRTSQEICILCCNFNLPTVDAQDSGKEHRRATATWATSLHFGNSSGNIWKNIPSRKALTIGLWMLLRMIIGCWWSGIFYLSPNTMDDRFFCIRLCPEGVALDPASFDLT